MISLETISFWAVLSILASSMNPRIHSVLAPFILVMVILDTLLANPAISVG